MGDGDERRVANNESTFREINESIEKGRWPGEGDGVAAFRCECAELGCSVMVELTIEEYEHVRSDPRHFAVAVGHEDPSVEAVVERRQGYLVVEKRGEAGRFAEASDPRG